MAVWRAVLLLNLALAVGVGWGYLWWGRQAQQLSRELTAARAAAATTGEREYRVSGVVRAILPEMNVLVVTHGEIPGYMPAMTMGFAKADAKAFPEVKPGDTVRFEFKKQGDDYQLVSVQRTGGAR